MHMWNHVAETGQIDLVGLDDLAHGGFDSEDDSHQFLLFVGSQIGHLGSVPIEDDAAKAKVVRIADLDDPAKGVTPKEFAAS